MARCLKVEAQRVHWSPVQHQEAGGAIKEPLHWSSWDSLPEGEKGAA